MILLIISILAYTIQTHLKSIPKQSIPNPFIQDHSSNTRFATIQRNASLFKTRNIDEAHGGEGEEEKKYVIPKAQHRLFLH